MLASKALFSLKQVCNAVANASIERLNSKFQKSIIYFYRILEYHFSLLFFTVFGNSQNSDDKSLQDVHTVAGLQDQAQLTLSKYIQATYPTQPFRFGKLLLSIPTLKTVCGNTIAELFFRKTIGNIPIERLLIDMFKSSDF